MKLVERLIAAVGMDHFQHLAYDRTQSLLRDRIAFYWWNAKRLQVAILLKSGTGY